MSSFRTKVLYTRERRKHKKQFGSCTESCLVSLQEAYLIALETAVPLERIRFLRYEFGPRGLDAFLP